MIRFALKVWDLLLDSAVPFLANLANLFPGACVHGSLPCTAWSSYQRVNCAKFGPSYEIELEKSRADSVVMLSRFRTFASAIVANGGFVSFEWPRNFDGWLLEDVVLMTEECKLLPVSFDGCQLGVKSKKGNPIKKPWQILTNSEAMVKRMGRYKCKCAKGSHERCQGGETCRTGFYNCKLARCIIKSLCPSLSSKFQNISTHSDKPSAGAGSVPKKSLSKAVVDVHKPPVEAALREHAQVKPSDQEAAVRALMQMKPSTEAARVVKKHSPGAAPAKDSTLVKYRHTYNDIVKNHLDQID